MIHIRKYNEKLTYSEFTNILKDTPQYFPVFKVTEDYVEYYTEDNRLIPKGTEIYADNPFNTIEVRTICPLNYYTEVEEEYLEFVEYRLRQKIDRQLKEFQEYKKYNL